MDRFTPERNERGTPVVRCRCETCDTEAVVRCAHLSRHRTAGKVEVDEGQAIVKLRAAGWSFVKNVLRCPKCEITRKEKNVSKEVTVAPPLRQPTREQKRLIVAALDDAYDMTNLRYKGQETDKSIAEMLDDGIMPGWVAAVREDMFGPDGNEEMTKLAADMAAWMKKVDAGLNLIRSTLLEVDTARAEVKKYQERLNKIVAAIGPKAEKI